MAEGTRDYKRLEGMLKEFDQKREKEFKEGEQKRKKDIARVDAVLEEIKAMINGMTFQQNDLRTQLNNHEARLSRGSILGNPVEVVGEATATVHQNHNNRYATKLDFPRFNGEGVEEWIFKVEQFFVLERTSEQSKIGVVALHLEGGALYWHRNFIKLRERMPSWGEYVQALRRRFGPLAYEDPMAEVKKLKQMGSLEEYVKAFEMLMDKAQLNENQAVSCFLAGLRHEVEMMVRMFNPRTLQDAYSLAKLQEALRKDPMNQG